jgi:hypothetical protein
MTNGASADWSLVRSDMKHGEVELDEALSLW